MNVKPGDLFQWVYAEDNTPVPSDEQLYSVELGFIPCSGMCICIGVNVTSNFNSSLIYWISNKRLFCARPKCSSTGKVLDTKTSWLVIPQRIET